MKWTMITVLLFVACSESVEPRSDINRPCYDECDRNSDCMDGLACSELQGNVCVPIQCIECLSIPTRNCCIDEEYTDGKDYPACTYIDCKEGAL